MHNLFIMRNLLNITFSTHTIFNFSFLFCIFIYFKLISQTILGFIKRKSSEKSSKKSSQKVFFSFFVLKALFIYLEIYTPKHFLIHERDNTFFLWIISIIGLWKPLITCRRIISNWKWSAKICCELFSQK